MFVCYIDESGYTGNRSDPQSPFLVMAGVLVNTYKMHKTHGEFREIVNMVKERTGQDFTEVKGKDLYIGRGVWSKNNSGLDGRERQELYRDILLWFRERQHKVVVSIINNAAFFAEVSENEIAEFLQAPYVAAALHIALMIQRRNQSLPSNKGKTLLIFDQQKEFEKAVARLIAFPPLWSDAYYGRNEKKEQLDQIIDTAYFVRSHHASFIQIADLIAYAVRKFVELEEGQIDEKYEGEREKITTWYHEIIAPTLIERRHRLPRSGGPFVDLLRAVTPTVMR